MLDLPPFLPQMSDHGPPGSCWMGPDPTNTSLLQGKLRPRLKTQAVPYHGAEGPEHVRPSPLYKQDQVLAFSHM